MQIKFIKGQHEIIITILCSTKLINNQYVCQNYPQLLAIRSTKTMFFRLLNKMSYWYLLKLISVIPLQVNHRFNKTYVGVFLFNND